MEAPTTSPWGSVQHSDELAEGIVQVHTASHGGIKLSDERLAQMPTDQRTSDGWYEEDCEAAFVYRHFLDAGVIELGTKARAEVERWWGVMKEWTGGGNFAQVRMSHH